MNKPLSPTVHGVMDYVLSGALFSLPSLLKLNKGARTTYAGLGAGYLAVDALTNAPTGLKKLIPLELHRKIDIGVLAGTALLTATKLVRGDKKALRFHLGLLAVAALNFVLTDYERD